ncbi:hypothetical protein NL676_002508 [Syzygium grande]|nr:hypothetical protein NL676_002508 [Syzygium grande]
MHVASVDDGPDTILFLHGFPELWYSWRHQMVSLSAGGYRAVAPDLRGATAAPTHHHAWSRNFSVPRGGDLDGDAGRAGDRAGVRGGARLGSDHRVVPVPGSGPTELGHWSTRASRGSKGSMWFPERSGGKARGVDEGDYGDDYLRLRFQEHIFGRRVQEAVPNLEEVVVMEGLAHFLQQEKPQEVTAHILDFFKKFSSP